MNKIFQSGGRWQVLKKRVSPAVIIFQAMLATGAVLLLTMLLKYRPESGTPVTRNFRHTYGLTALDTNLAKLSGTLDPASFTREKQVAIPQFQLQDMVKIKLLRPRPVPVAAELPVFRELPVAERDFYPDLRVTPAEATPSRSAMAVMYDEYGNELGRWEESAVTANTRTVFRIDNNGAVQYPLVTESCGSCEVDQKAVSRAMKLRLNSGIYSVWYPNVKREI